MYRFSWRSPLHGGKLGACHALDVPFALGTFALPKLRDFAGAGPEAERVAHAMMDAWVAFARSGDPSHAGHPGLAAVRARRAAPRSSSARPAACSTRPARRAAARSRKETA